MQWKTISSKYEQHTKIGLVIQHQVIQFLALAGKYLTTEKADDSHTNIIFDTDRNWFIGQTLANGHYLAIDAIELDMMILNSESKILNKFALEGKTKAKIFKWMKTMLFGVGINVDDMKMEMHYELEEHPLDRGAFVTFDDIDGFEENVIFRHNAELVLKEVLEQMGQKVDIRIWPHHFDTGALIPVEYGKDGELLKYIGLGFAIPDDMIDVPYFYLSFWSKDKIADLENPEELLVGKWMTPKWNGAVLTQNDILKVQSPQIQHQMVKDFYRSGLEILKAYFPY